MKSQMKIVMKNIDELIRYENNPRDNVAAIPYVANSIEAFNFKVPILIDKNNVIIAGHTRLEAAITIGYKEVPCIVADDMTDEQVRKFRLVDNKTHEYGKWDYDKLEEELESIFDIDMESFGFQAIAEPAHEKKSKKSSERDEYYCICPRCKAEFFA